MIPLKNNKSTGPDVIIAMLTLTFVLIVEPANAEPYAYVTLLNANSVAVIDTEDNTIVTTVAVGSGPREVRITPDGRFAWVANDYSGTVSVIDVSTNVVVDTISGFSRPVGMAFTPDGTRAYVVNFGGGRVKVVNMTTRDISATIETGNDSYGIAMLPSGTHVYVSNRGGNPADIANHSVWAIETATNTVVAKIEVGPGPHWLAATDDSAYVYVGSEVDLTQTRGSVSKIDTVTNTVVADIATGGRSVGIVLSPDELTLYATNLNDARNVSVIDTNEDTEVSIISNLALMPNPLFLDITPDGQRLYVTNPNPSIVSVIDLPSNTVVQSIPVSGLAVGIAIAPALTTVANAGSDQTVGEAYPVILDGTASINAINFSWRQLAGPTISPSSTTASNLFFTAPYVPANTTLTFELIVDDGAGKFSEPDTVDVTVVNINNPPVSDAGDDGTIKEGAVAILNGSNSFDPESDTPLGYTWTQSDGPLVALTPSNTVASPSFTAPLGVGTTLTFELVVDDDKESSLKDDVVIAVVENSAPAAEAGPDQTVDEGTRVSLDGTESNDPDGGDTLSFDWSEPVALDDDNSSTPSFTAPSVGLGGQDFEFFLEVTDDDPVNPKSAVDSIVTHVRNTNDPPSCDLAVASKVSLWPPNHKLIGVSIEGVMDKDSVYNAVTLQITGVSQDEPVKGLGDGDSSPDAVIQVGDPADSVLIRSERSGGGNGRVYVVNFTASDGFESCAGHVNVSVPHSRKSTAIDDGQVYNATLP